MDASDASLDDREQEAAQEPPEPPAEVAGDHPDPVTLCQPEYDGRGLLRWGSIPAPGV